MEKNDKCVVAVCPNKKSTCPNMKFFDFPADIQRTSFWLFLIKRTDILVDAAIENYQICENHFEPMFVKAGKTLTAQAYPSIDDLKVEMKENADKNEDRSYRGSLLNMFQKNYAADFQKKFTQNLAESKKLKENSLQMTEISLRTFFASKEYYNFVKNNMFSTYLDPYSLTVAFKKWPIMGGGGASEIIYKALEMKVERFKKSEKNCNIIAVEIKFKELVNYSLSYDSFEGLHDAGTDRKRNFVADTAILLQAQGLSGAWKHNLGYIAVYSKCPDTEDDLKNFILTSIENLQSMKIKCHAFISEVTDILTQFSNKIGISVHNSHFTVGTDEIYFVFDPISLVLEMRNCLKENDFFLKEGPIKWEMLELVPEKIRESKKKIKCNITEVNFDDYYNFHPANFELATNIFSEETGKAILKLREIDFVPQIYQTTANFCISIDKAFKTAMTLLYSPDRNLKYALYVEGITDEKYGEEFEKVNKMMKNLRIVKKANEEPTKSSRFRVGWRITLNSIERLMKKTMDNPELYGETELVVNNSTLNSLWDLLPKTTIDINKLRSIIKEDFGKSYLVDWDSKITTEKIDFLKCLQYTTFYDFNKKSKLYTLIEKYSAEKIELDPKYDHQNNQINIAGERFYYKNNCKDIYEYVHKVCTQRYFKVLERKCDDCGMDFNGKSKTDQRFMDFCCELDLVFGKNFKKCVVERKAGKNILDILKTVKFEGIKCPNFPTEFMLKVFLRCRIDVTVRKINDILKNGGSYADFDLEQNLD